LSNYALKLQKRVWKRFLAAFDIKRVSDNYDSYFDLATLLGEGKQNMIELIETELSFSSID